MFRRVLDLRQNPKKVSNKATKRSRSHIHYLKSASAIDLPSLVPNQRYLKSILRICETNRMANLLYLGWGVLKIAAATRLSLFSVYAILKGCVLSPRYPVLKHRLGALQRSYVLGTLCFAQPTLLSWE